MLILLVSAGMGACAPAPAAVPPPTAVPNPTRPPEPVVLTMGSWRVDDVEQMNRILAQFTALHPNITVRYITYSTSDVAVYNPILESMLQQGTAPDLFYLTSYSFANKLFSDGYLERLDQLPGLASNFSPAMRAPWASQTGQVYGVPFIATSHGVYYNKTVFQKMNLPVPATWEELLQTAASLKQAGLTPFANTSGEGWTMAEIVFMNLAPNFIGGYAGRQEYLDGTRCFNEPGITATFQAIADLAPYLPENQALLNYSDSLQLFLQGQAAMWLGGSWDIPFFEAQNPPFEWGVFAVPPPAGAEPQITFHLDAGMGLNAASTHKNEAKLFLEWMASPEFGELLGNELPGFFPMHTRSPGLQSQHANEFLQLNEGRGQDVRFSWEQISDGTPDAYSLIMNGSIEVVNGRQSPQQAADALQNGLAQWFAPAQKCGN